MLGPTLVEWNIINYGKRLGWIIYCISIAVPTGRKCMVSMEDMDYGDDPLSLRVLEESGVCPW
jgi:hypothetical protein